jgi:hypothetical protein
VLRLINAWPVNRNDLLEGTVSQGLALFEEVRHIDDQDELIRKMQANISPVFTDSFENMFGWTRQQLRRWDNPSEKDRLEEQGVDLSPAEDKESQPPLIWHLSKLLVIPSSFFVP